MFALVSSGMASCECVPRCDCGYIRVVCGPVSSFVHHVCVCVCACVCVCVCMSPTLSQFCRPTHFSCLPLLSPPLSVSVSLCLYLSLYVSVSLTLSLSPPLSLFSATASCRWRVSSPAVYSSSSVSVSMCPALSLILILAGNLLNTHEAACL